MTLQELLAQAIEHTSHCRIVPQIAEQLNNLAAAIVAGKRVPGVSGARSHECPDD